MEIYSIIFLIANYLEQQSENISIAVMGYLVLNESQFLSP